MRRLLLLLHLLRCCVTFLDVQPRPGAPAAIAVRCAAAAGVTGVVITIVTIRIVVVVFIVAGSIVKDVTVVVHGTAVAAAAARAALKTVAVRSCSSNGSSGRVSSPPAVANAVAVAAPH